MLKVHGGQNVYRPYLQQPTSHGENIRPCSAMSLALGGFWIQLEPVARLKKFYQEKSITAFFILDLKDISYESSNPARFYTFFVIFVLFLHGEILMSVSVNQQNILIFSPQSLYVESCFILWCILIEIGISDKKYIGIYIILGASVHP